MLDIVKGKVRFGFFVLYIVIFPGCSSKEPPEGHIIFYDTGYEESFKNELDSRGVPYTSVGDSEITYSVIDKKKIDEIRGELLLNYPVSYELFDKAMAEVFSECLSENSIEYTMYEQDGGGNRFVLDKKYRKISRECWLTQEHVGR